MPCQHGGMPGGYGNRNSDRSFYGGKLKPHRTRPLPGDFRERYLEMGWEAQWYFSCNWLVMCRWIDEAGGEELTTARRNLVRERGRNMPNKVHHAAGWSAEKLDALHNQRE